MQHVFIIGSKGIPGAYGGYETFVDKLTEYHKNNPNIKYHVACKSNENGDFEYHNARCFKIKVPNIGAAQAIYYDVLALRRCCSYIKKNHIEKPIIYILACRIGPFAGHFIKLVHGLGGRLYVNPDGHEWKRAKWSLPVRKYWKISERLMVKHADLLICDSKNIQQYIEHDYAKYRPTTRFIAYGSEVNQSTVADDNDKYTSWMRENGLVKKGYYLVVGRFVPENNFETMIREFMISNTKRDFALVTNVSNKFLAELEVKTGFDKDPRIKFVGTMYDQEILKKIRENAYGYFHGHEVGGTNPSLLEALASTDLNLLLDVGFNREVAESAAIYWNKEHGNLAAAIDRADLMTTEEIVSFAEKAKRRIMDAYSWNYITSCYEEVFTWKEH